MIAGCMLSFLSEGHTQEKNIHIQGTVFLDKNGNGILDKCEKGVNHILLSNGKDVVKADKKGRFTLNATAGQSVFPILPSGYGFSNAGQSIGNANYSYLDPDKVSETALTLNFALRTETQSRNFSIGAIGDVQVDNEEELEFAAKSVIRELAQRNDLAFNMVLGDLVNDNMKLMPAFKDLLQGVPTTSWTMVGNHDRNTESEEVMDNVFNRNFGADTYAFNYAGVHFIVLNNVYATGKKSYEGRVSEDQLEFLKNDLAQVKKGTTVVLSQHIPMAHTRNKKEVLGLLAGFDKVLFLSGHTHTVNRYFFDSIQYHELGAGATCGNWWRGEKNAEGIPDALMQCGAPRGYFVVSFDKDGDYEFKYKAVGEDAAKQVRLYVDDGKLVANVYGGSDSTTVRLNVDNSGWQDMIQVRRVDPWVDQLVDMYKSKVYPTQGNTRNPLGKRESSHVWEMTVPIAATSTLRRVELRAEDSYGFKVSEVFFMKL